MTAIRYPLAPLAQALGINLTAAGTFGGVAEDTGIDAVADRLDISQTTAHRLRREGLTALAADRYAMAAGIHPARVWSTWWADVSEANREHGEIACVCDDDLDQCGCGFYADDPPLEQLQQPPLAA